MDDEIPRANLAAPSIYKSLLLAIERRRLELGWSFSKVAERAALEPEFYSKLWGDTEKKRAGWQAFQWIIEEMYPGGYDIELKAVGGPMHDALSTTASQNGKRSPGAVSQRQHMRNLRARSPGTSHLSAERRSKIARKAARARWRQFNAIRIR